ncbi:MAG: hypothetical protein CMJ59_22285, partial [Planctomycetaceae bacterium]|nr:hypothetical protein [Planctomycetaceae bacterium]
MAKTNVFNPFPGLRPFNAEEDYLFFGREHQTNELLQLLRTHRFIAVVGTSGSGKSSLVRAGVLPALFGGTMVGVGSQWETVVFRPGGDPLINLAQGMIDSDLYDPEDAEAPLRIRATLSRSRLGLAQAVEQSDLTDQTNLLIVVDQFEELFRFRDTTPEHQGLATAFVKLLLNAAADENQPIYVAITMRSDYLGDCAQIPGLAEAVNHGEYLIPKLTRDQRRDAIEKPTAVGGGKMSPALVQQLLNDVGDDADQLPILQHALMRIWNKWESGHEADEPIGLRHYDSVGGLQSALSLHADEVYTELRDEDMRALAERVFKAITEKGEDKRGIRRPTRLDHLCQIVDGAPEDVNLVLDAYRKAGRTFVMPTGKTELVPETVVDISHESLMRVWERLKGWVGEESQSARIYRRLADTAALHADGRAGVYRDPDLQIASSWRERSRPTEAWADRYHAGLETALAFLDKSWDTAHAEEEERERARQRELKQAQRLAEAERQRAEVQAKAKRRLYVLLGGISVALLVAIGMYLYAEQQRTLAESNRLEAMENERRATANAAEARRQEVVARENASEAQRQEGIARENAAEAENQAERARQAREEARRRLYISNMLTAHRAFELGEGISRAAQLLGDWRPKAVERDIRGWEWYYLSAQQRSAGEVLSTGTRWRGAAVWSPVEEVLAYAANDYSVVVYDRAKRQEIKRLVGHGDDVMSLAFSHDGRLLVSGSRDQTVRLWDVEVGVEMQVMKGHRGGVHSVAWSPDQKRVVSAAGGPSFGSGHTARIWDVKTGTMSRMVSGEWPGWMSSRWSPDGKYLATAYHAHRVVIRNGESYEEVRTLTTRSPTVVCLEWATDSKRLATGDESGIIQIWNVEDGQEVGALTGHTGQIRSLVWSPDDSELLTGGHDGSVRVWTVEQSALKKVVSNAGFQVMDLAWSRDGREFLVNGANGTLWIHAAEETQASRNRSQHSGIGSSVQWNPVDKRIAFGGDDRQVYVLDPTSTTDATLLSGHQGKVNAVCWSGDGRWLASASNDRTVRIWSGESLELVKELTGFIGEVCAIDWSPDGSKLAVGVAQNDANAFSNSGGNVERGVVVFDVSDPRNASLMYEFAAHQATFAVAWHPDSGQLATAGMNRRNDGDRIRVWDVVSGRQVNQVSLPFENVYALDWSSDGMRLAAGTNDGVNNGHVKVVDMTDSSVLLDLLGQVSVFSVSFNASASRLVAAGKDQTVKIWDIESGAELLSLSASSSSVFSAAWSPDETKIAAIGAELILYDAYDGFLQELSPSLLDALGEEIEDGTGGVAARESRAEIFSLLNQWDDAESDLKAVGESPDSQQSWFIMPWRIRGPFDEHSNQNTAIDRVPDPFARGPGVLSAGGDEWKPIPLEDDGLVNMARFTGGRED